MRGASSLALAEVSDRLAASLASVDVSTAEAGAGDLLAVASLLGRERVLARALADPGTDGQGKRSMVESLVGERIGALALAAVCDAVSMRWSSPTDLVYGLEHLGAQAAFDASARAASLDAVEDQLFRLARVVERSSELTASLKDPEVPADGKAALVGGLLAGKADPTTIQLATYVASNLRGRNASEVLQNLAEQAAARQDRKIAIARVAVPLDADLKARLESALAGAIGQGVRLQVEVQPDVVGGIVVQVGDEVIDGSVASRLGQVARGLTT